MSVLSPIRIRERYSNTDIRREKGGRKILIDLPKNSQEGLEEAARILSTHECRKCSKCCSKGFSFMKKDPHYEKIMRGLEEKGTGFTLVRKGFFGNEYFEVFVPEGAKACPFLEGHEPAHSELDFTEGLASEGKGALFGCRLYSTRPSVCAAYPFIWDVLDPKYWKFGADEGFAAIDPNCAAVWELAKKGIGHLTLSEIKAIAEMAGNAAENMLTSIGFSLAEIRKRVEERGAWGKIFRTEEGEEVYPLNFIEISHPWQKDERR